MPDSKAPATHPNVSSRYITEATLGQGGMGIIYRAYDNITKRHVAVKTMWGNIEPQAYELFEREWTVLSRLSHPNIVDMLDRGEYEDEHGQKKPYFVMPLLPGKTLDEIIKKESQRLTVGRVVEIICQACRGLQAAREQQLVHRDLKPSNIFVMDDDTAKIIDFGVAHLAESGSVTGIKGTLQYMAPEQADMSSPVSARSDIFALAVVTYEALTGRKPFARRTEHETIDAIRTHIPPPASEINGDVNNMLARTVHKAMAKQPLQRFPSAREFADTLQRAMRNEPIERFDAAKIRPRIEGIKKAYNEGKNTSAMELLTELESEGHIDPDMPVLRMQIEQSERQQTIRQLLEGARMRMEADAHPQALQKLAEVLALDPNNIDAQALRSQIERQRGEKQLEQWFRLVEEHRENQLFSQARQGLQEILKIDSANTRARTMLAEIDRTEQEVVKFKEDKQRLYDGALASYRNGEISSALSKLERGLDLSHKAAGRPLTTELDAQYQSFYNQVRSERDSARNAYAEGRKSLEDKNTERALEICGEYLQKHPNDPMFQALRLEAEEMQRQEQSSAVAEVNRRSDLEPDLDKRFNIMKEACERFPNEAHFALSLTAVRQKRDLVNSIVARSRQYEERGQFLEATNQWDILRSIYPAYPGIEFEVERLARRREEHAHSEAKARWMERIDSLFRAGEYAQMHQVIEEAQVEFPNDKELEGMKPVAEQGIRRSAEAKVLMAQGRERCAAKDYDAGLAALRKAKAADPNSGAAHATLLSCLVEHARDLISQDWRAAEPFIKEANDLNPEDPVVRSLVSLKESHQRQDEIDNIVVEARGLQAVDNIPGAVKKVEEGLQEYPNDVRLVQLQNTLRAAATHSKIDISAAADRPIELSKMAAAGEQHDSLEAPLGFAATSFLSAQPVEAREAERAKEEVAHVPAAPAIFEKPSVANAPALPRKPIQPTPGPTPGPKMPIWLLAVVAAAVLIVASLLYKVLQHKSGGSSATTATKSTAAVMPTTAEVPVNLTANEAGATFKLDGAPVAAALSVKPGEHTGEADLEGFAPDIHTFTVGSNVKGPITVAFTMRPSLPELLFSSGLGSGTAILDNGDPVDLQEGSFNRNDLKMGPHSLRILEGKREILSFAFDAEPKQLIKLTGPLTTHGGSGIVISSMAGAAQLYGTPGLKAAIEGQSQQPIPTDGLAIPAAHPPSHVSVVEGDKSREFTADAAPRPILSVILSGGVERVPLTITANVPDGAVSIDGTVLKRKLANGSRFLPLAPGVYNISVVHDGYQPAPPQHIVIRNGDSAKTLDFQLSPILRLASVEMTGAPAEAAVFLDDVRVGTVNSGGNFAKDVNPGSHVLTVRKAGLEEFKQAHEFRAGEPFHLAVQMHSVAALVVLHVSPANAKITLRKDTGIFTPKNGQTESMPPGTYILTATADDYQQRSESVQVEAGRPLNIDWALQPITKQTAVVEPAIPFANPKAWSLNGGWLAHSGGGISFYNGGNGSRVVDFLKKKRLGFTKHVVFDVDFIDKGNYTQYSLDGKSLSKIVYTNGQPGEEKKFSFGQDTGDTIRMMIEQTSDSFTIKNRSGAVIDTIKKSNMGRFAFVDDVTLHITQ